MKPKLTYHLTIYLFAVIMILLRPFFAYQMSERGAFQHDPVRVYQLLQRLIKKKELHAEDAAEANEIVQSDKKQIILPLLVAFIFSRRPLAWLLTALSSISKHLERHTLFEVCPTNRYHRLIAKFQI